MPPLLIFMIKNYKNSSHTAVGYLVKINKIFILVNLFAFLLFFVFVPLNIYSAPDLGSTCSQISSSENSCQNLSSAECQAILQECANYYDNQSAEIAKDLTKTKQQKNTLQNQVSFLKKKITSLEYQINQGTLMVKDLNLKINDTEKSISSTTSNILDSQNQIATILKSVYEEDKKNSLIILLEGDLSNFFSNMAYLESLNQKVSSLLESTTDLKSYLEEQKIKIDDEKVKVQKTLQIQNLQKKENEQNKKQQESYLKITESQYQKQLKDKQEAEKNANAIKARIFDLIGVSKAPTFGEALEIAKYVSSVTGVRPAFLLAVITQESSLGKNVGQCYLTNFENGDGTNLQGITRKRVMSPKSISNFISLTEGLGMDPKKTPVSCWVPLYTSNGIPYGWGGAMGPAQFIASTWSSYTGKVSEIIDRIANPWNINDSFLASGLLLRDNGAKTSEFNAAAKYYCGGNYGRYECRAYANSVLKFTSQYEADIKAIGG